MKKENLSRQVTVWLTAIIFVFLLVLGFGVSRKVHAQERTQTFYASQFPGADKGTKVNNALAACTNPNITCVVVVDSILGSWPVGSGYNTSGGQLVIDYSALGTVQFSGGAGASVAMNGSGQVVVTGGSSGVLPASAGGGSLGTTAQPFGQLVIGDGSGRTRWLAGCCTATRSFSTPDGNSSSVMPASFTTTAATTDNVSVTGMTASGHCDLQATNSAAAAGIASVFVSGKATNQITVTHTATAGWTFDVLCTAQ